MIVRQVFDGFRQRLQDRAEDAADRRLGVEPQRLGRENIAKGLPEVSWLASV